MKGGGVFGVRGVCGVSPLCSLCLSADSELRYEQENPC